MIRLHQELVDVVPSPTVPPRAEDLNATHDVRVECHGFAKVWSRHANVLYRLRQYPIPQGSWADETLGPFGAPVVAIFETNVFFVHGDAYWSAQGNARFVCDLWPPPKMQSL